MTNREFHPSAVGEVVDVATPTWWKAVPLAVMWLFFAVPCLMTAGVIVYIAVTEKTEWFFCFISILPFLFGWFALTSSLYWLRTAFRGDYYLRAGPGGLSVCLPGETRRLGLGVDLLSFDVPWNDVKTWYPYVRTVNGILSESSIVIEGERGWKARIHTAHFAESRETIVENIARAAAVPRQRTAS